MAITQFILGIRPTYEGLQIAPVIPKSWTKFTAYREYRGCKYQINVERIVPGNSISLTANGVKISGNVIPLPDKNEIEMSIHVAIE